MKQPIIPDHLPVERRPRKRGQQADLRDIYVTINKVEALLENLGAVVVETEHETADNSDGMSVKGLDMPNVGFDLVAGFSQGAKVVLLDRFKAHQHRDASRTGHQKSQIRIRSDVDLSLSYPVNPQRFERLKKGRVQISI